MRASGYIELYVLDQSILAPSLRDGRHPDQKGIDLIALFMTKEIRKILESSVPRKQKIVGGVDYNTNRPHMSLEKMAQE